MDVALKWGYKFDVTCTLDNNWFDLPREMRAVLVAQEQISRLESMIQLYEDKRERAMKKGG